MDNLPRPTNATSPARPSSLPDSWIEKLFQKFEDFYGSKWADQFGAFPRERVKATWAEELAGFAAIPDAIKAALDAQKASMFPPTLPEFLQLCRDAAHRFPAEKPMALEHKLTPEQIEINKQRIREMVNSLAHGKRIEGMAD